MNQKQNVNDLTIVTPDGVVTIQANEFVECVLCHEKTGVRVKTLVSQFKEHMKKDHGVEF